MTKTPVLVGLNAEGKPIYELRHPYEVFGKNHKPDLFVTVYKKVGDRMRHVLTRPKTRQQAEFMPRSNLPRVVTVPVSWKLDPTVSRQVRRQIERLPRMAGAGE
jgi:hypothetical protein